MKRLIGYISLVASMLFALLVALVPSFISVNGTGDYESMKTYVYKISEKTLDIANGGTTDDGNISEEDKQDRLDDVVDEFKTRLSNAGVSDYKLETSGLDTIKVSFKVDSSLYSDVSSYLTWSWSMQASTYDEKVTAGQNPSEVYSKSGSANFFKSGDARIEYKDNYPYVVISLSDPDQFKTIYTTAKDAEAPSKDDSSEDDEEETSTADQNKIFILNNFVDGLEIKDLLTNSGNNYITSSQIKDHILFSIDATSITNVYWDYDADLTEEEQKETTYEEIYFGNYNSSSNIYDSQESNRVLAYKKANIWMHKFNASSYDCNVTLININGTDSYSKTIAPFVDYLVYMNDINWSNGLYISSLIALIVVSLFLILNYGINGVSALTNALAMFIVSIGLFNTFGSEFNLGAIIGLLTLVTLSLFSSTIYFKKIKDEMYLGKNIKKAYLDGGKKSFASQIDFSVVTLILGITSYLIPNSMLISFGSLLIVGSILNVVLNVIILRLLTWLIYNSSTIANNVKLIAIDKKRIPDLSKDEKPTYFEQYKKHSDKKVSKISAIVSSVLLLAGIVSMTTFGIIRGSIYNNSSTATGSEIVIRIDKRNVSDDDERDISRYEEDIEDILLTRFYQSETKALFTSVDLTSYNYEYLVNKVTNKEYYFVTSLNGIYDKDSTIYVKNNDDQIVSMNFEEALNEYIMPTFSNSGEVVIHSLYNVNNDSNNYYVLLFVSIGIAVTSVYMLLRFNVSKTIVSIILIGGGVTITVGLFSLVNVSFPSSITFGALFLVFIAYLIFISLFNKEKEVYAENKKALSDFDLRNEKYEEVLNNYYELILNTSLISIFMVISLFFSSGLSQYLLILMIIGLFIILVLLKTLSLPFEMKLSLTFNKWKNNIHEKNEAKKAKKNLNKKKDDYEGPEESIFIGIND